MRLFGITVSYPRTKRHWRSGALLMIAYIAATRISSALFAAPAIIFPASGIALGGLFLEGLILWPFVYFASLIGYILNGSTLVTMAVLPVAHTLQAVLGAWLLRKLNVDPIFHRLRDMFAVLGTSLVLAIFVPLVGMFILGPLNQHFYGIAPSSVTLISWYTGTLFSLLFFAPFVMRWLSKPYFNRSWSEILEIAAAFGLLALISVPLFWDGVVAVLNISLVYFLLVPFFWMALRMGTRFLTLALVFLAVVAISGTMYGMGAPGAEDLGMRLFQVQIFLNIIALIFYVLVSLQDERTMAQSLLISQVQNLRGALDQLASQNHAKTEFIAMLAHELRNPLAPIASGIDLLKAKVSGEDAGTLDVMHSRMQTVKRLLDDLLDVSRITEQKLSLQKETVDLSALARHAALSADHYFKERDQTLLLNLPDTPVLIEADPVRIEQVLTNLLTNASKFSNMGEEVSLTVRQSGSIAEVLVVDQGVGIEKEMISRIFEPFLQVELGQRTRQGLGIGLALVRNLIEMHGGTVKVRSEGKDKGSQFSVLLPLSTGKAPEAKIVIPSPISGSDKAPGAGKKVLVVDDNDAAAWGIGKLLEIKGYEIEYAYDAEQVFARVEEFTPDAILLDIGLPDQSGYDVAKTLRAQGYAGTLVALTGYSEDDDLDRAKEVGFDHHLVKPVGIAELRKVLPRNS